MRRPLTWCVAAGVALAAAGACWADTLVRKDGTALRGRVRSQDETAITFEVDVSGGRLVVSVPLEDVAAVTPEAGERTGGAAARPAPAERRPAPAPAGPGYCVLPIRGEIGVEVTAEALEHALTEVARQGPEVLVLDIDCPGGAVDEAAKILAVLANLRGVRLVAYVRRAEWAGAAVAMTCPQVVMAPGSTIGAPRPRRPDGIAQPVDKQLEATMLSLLTSAAQAGNHSRLIALGLLDTELELSVAQLAGRPAVMEGLGWRVLKTRGTTLALSAGQAVTTGLAVGVASQADDIGELIGLKPWHRLHNDAWMYLVRKGADSRRKWQDQQRLAARQAYWAMIAPTVREIDEELAAVQAAGRAAEATRDDLKAQYEAEVDQIEREYRHAVWLARHEGTYLTPVYPGDRIHVGYYRIRQDANVAANLVYHAKELRDLKMLELRSRYQPQAMAVERQINDLYEQQQRLLDRRKRLLDAAPK